MQQDVGPQEVPIEQSFGEVLVEARKAKGYSVEDIVASLKLRPRQIQALEAGQLDQISGGITYVRGMIKNYAKLVGIDPEPILKQIKMDNASDALDSNCFTPGKLKVLDRGKTFGSMGSTISWRPNRQLVVLALVAIFLGAILWVVPDNTAIHVKEFFAQQTDSLAGWWTSAANDDRAQALEVVPEAAEMNQAVAEPVPTEFLPAEPALEAEKVPDEEKNQYMGRVVSSPTPVASGTLKMTFAESSWVEIREQRSRKRVFSGLVAAGAEHTFTANLPVELKVGNAQSATLSFNGSDVGLLPYTRQGVARLLLQ